MKLNMVQRGLLGLISRSTDAGDGWRNVSDQLWPSVSSAAKDCELFEVHEEAQQVRISEAGLIVQRWL